MIDLRHSDCLAEMATLPDQSIDMVLTDPPYGTTQCKWDAIVPLAPMWAQLKRVTKPNAAIVMTAGQPFTTTLIASNFELFRYTWVWDKTRGSNFANARRQPMKSHEDVLVFYRKQPIYNPQFWYSTPYQTKQRERSSVIAGVGAGINDTCTATVSEDGRRYPLSIIEIKRDGKREHPTQKPVALMEYLVKTYTNPGARVLDFTMGSGTTGVACRKLLRRFVGIEKDAEYFALATRRIHETPPADPFAIALDYA